MTSIGSPASSSSAAWKSNWHGKRIIAVAKKESKLLGSGINFNPSTFVVKAQRDVGVALLLNLQEMLNFTIEAKLGDSIRVSENGTVSGRTYELLRSGGGDIFVEQSTLLPEEAHAFSFLQPLEYGTGVMVIFAQPSFLSVRNVLVDTFAPNMWFALGLAGFILLSSVIITQQFSDRVIKSDHEYYCESPLLWLVALYCQKGWQNDPKKLSLRLIVLSGSILTYVVYSSYSAVITSVLSVEQIPIRSVEDLIGLKFRFYAFNGSKTTQAFLEDYFIPRHNLSQKPLVFTTEEEAELLRTPKRAVLSYDDKFYGSMEESGVSRRFFCRRVGMISATGVKEPTLRSMLVPKGSNLKETFGCKLQILRERGFTQRYLLQYTHAIRPRCATALVSEAHQFRLRDVYIAFATYGAVAVLSSLLFGMERMAHGFRSKVVQS